MQSTAIMPRTWKQPLFAIGQRTQQGRIIGINYSTQKQSEGWYYSVLVNETSGQVVQLPETQVRLLSKQEIEAKILAEIDLHLARLTILQQELDADLEIRTPFGTVTPPISQTPRSSNGTSRLSEPKKKVSA
ncbi:hypothetical protein FNW02_30590 [Komarekiella sp. 'clone 1']|uniref:Uncharacterized protein n=1 Tax=Komarekiella delphini-convector SJRDD-AB1 TaxID=2593771 RepID=A0AA40T328_9NOST|nr:hypothetical protein [Komarekiella delphini-convector]MBD6620028.1 hypothetical protein [Komarekiella delphini-convector SJRDD-AB1]